MLTKVQKWGNSQGVRLSRNVLDGLQIQAGDEVDVSVNDGAIVIRPIHPVRGKRKLEDLVSRIPDDYQRLETDWGKPVGREAW